MIDVVIVSVSRQFLSNTKTTVLGANYSVAFCMFFFAITRKDLHIMSGADALFRQ